MIVCDCCQKQEAYGPVFAIGIQISTNSIMVSVSGRGSINELIKTNMLVLHNSILFRNNIYKRLESYPFVFNT